MQALDNSNFGKQMVQPWPGYKKETERPMRGESGSLETAKPKPLNTQVAFRLPKQPGRGGTEAQRTVASRDSDSAEKGGHLELETRLSRFGEPPHLRQAIRSEVNFFKAK